MSAKAYRIGQLAQAAGVTADTLRYYERIGLLPKAQRTASGYRTYGPAAFERLRFIKEAQALGLSLRQIRELVRFSEDGGGLRRCRRVHDLLTEKLAELDARLEQLARLREKLRQYHQQCEQMLGARQNGECPVVEQLTGQLGLPSSGP
jgi:DNA-binding transcriptional MerR regulator